MGAKPPFGLNYRELDVERDRNGVFFMWLFGILLAVFAVYLFIIGLADGLQNLTYAGIIMLPGSIVMLKTAFRTQRRIKDYDARKTR
jgi:hypothetical protein